MTRNRTSPSGVVLLVIATVLVAVPLAAASGPRASASFAVESRGILSVVGTPAPTRPGAAGVPVPAVPPAPTWINVTATGAGVAPPPGYGQSVVADPLTNTTVLFGGCLATQCPSDQTWTFSNGTWRNITATAGHPPARDYAAADFDVNMGGILLFGGVGVGSTLYNDTWLFHNGSWTNLTYVGGGPVPRYGAMMAYDPAPEENGSVLYGGCYASFIVLVCYNDTWVWQGWSGWVPLHPSLTGPAIGFGGLAYDPVDGYLVQTGGCAGTICLGFNNVTWEFADGQWSPTSLSPRPTGLADVGMVWDATTAELLLFGGLNATLNYTAATWAFSAGHWRLLAPSTAPTPRSDVGLSTDGSGAVPLLVGGSTAAASQNDTWVFEAPIAASIAAAANASEISQPVGFSASVVGGTGPYRVAVAFGDGADLSVVGAGPTFSFSHTFLKAGSYTATIAVTDAVGATASGSAAAIHLGGAPSVTASVAPAVGEAGVAVGLTAHATGGVGPDSYAWQFGDGSVGSGPSPTHTYAAAGSYVARVTVTDSVGGTGNASVAVTVVPALAVEIHVVPSAPTVGAPAGFVAAVTGGVAPFAYSWSFGGGHRSGLPAPVETFSKSGSFAIALSVNDSLGAHATAMIQVTVAAAPSPAAGLGAAPLWFWGGVGALGVVGAVGSFLLLRRGRAAA